MLNCSHLFVLKLKQSKKMTVGVGATPIVKQPLAKSSVPRDDQRGRGNALDSSAPAVRRGKEREQPKKKKPTALRKVTRRQQDCVVL